ncbi:hypothetical protein EDB80DRAFT_739555 [Ilyonectria destructans]|nr:hypothetical protein EDB80DRAFT_739555 [Ilyonectria destructans]
MTHQDRVGVLQKIHLIRKARNRIGPPRADDHEHLHPAHIPLQVDSKAPDCAHRANRDRAKTPYSRPQVWRLATGRTVYSVHAVLFSEVVLHSLETIERCLGIGIPEGGEAGLLSVRQMDALGRVGRESQQRSWSRHDEARAREGIIRESGKHL